MIDYTLSGFRQTLQKLVGECDLIINRGPAAIHGKPEDYTVEQLVRPLLEALGYSREFRIPQSEIPKPVDRNLSWVDFQLKGRTRALAFVEAKSIFEADLWTKYGSQVTDYIKNYLLSLKQEQPIKWIVLTNFRELHITYMLGRERAPFVSLTYKEFLTKAADLYEMLERTKLEMDRLLDIYYEQSNIRLDKTFLADLKRWRELIANGFKTTAPQLTVDQARALSELTLDRLILVRILESKGLQNYYSLVREYEHWKTATRNKDRFPFYARLRQVFQDLETDFDTELLKDDRLETIEQELRASGFTGELALPTEFLTAVIVPEEPFPSNLNAYISERQPQLLYRTIYNFDFNTLTDDVIGAVYEQYLAHLLVPQDSKLSIGIDPTRRQEEGAYYTPSAVVKYLVDATLGIRVQSILDNSLKHIAEGQFEDAHREISRLATLRVVDLACGSGAFLIRAFDVVYRAYEQYNEALRRAANEQQFAGDIFAQGRVAAHAISDLGERVIRDNIFGVDVDFQAVDVAKLNLWLKLLRMEPKAFTRDGTVPPQKHLPVLERNIQQRDAIFPWHEIDEVVPPGERVFVGNPPWGADWPYEAQLPEHYELARGQFDSYEIFLEKVIRSTREGESVGFIIPDSILLPEHERTRQLILGKCTINRIVKVGEGLFEGTFRGAVTLVLTKGAAGSEHKVLATILVKEDRQRLMHARGDGPVASTIMDIELSSANQILQKRFAENPHHEFDILVEDIDREILDKIEACTIDWDAVTTTGRGVEITKLGEVLQCPYCGNWNNIGKKRKGGGFHPKTCDCCGKAFEVHQALDRRQIIGTVKATENHRPVIIGEDINRYRILGIRYIDTSYARLVPRCPHCGGYDCRADFAAPKWVCPNCRESFARKEVKEWTRLGINYKDPELYEGDKILVRKTGRGIYATIDTLGAYTTQVVFIFRLNPARPKGLEPLHLEYLLGVLNSRLMLYYHYKKSGDVEWRSFPYVTQKVIKSLPVYQPDFAKDAERILHDQIAEKVHAIIARGTPPTEEEDAAIENLVRNLYGLTPEMHARIDAELKRIERFGPLLGAHDEDEDEEEAGAVPVALELEETHGATAVRAVRARPAKARRAGAPRRRRRK